MAALVRSSGDPSVIDTLGYVLIRNNRSEEALKVLERALSMAPDHPAIQYHHALALSELGRTTEAVAGLEKALAGGNFDERADAEKLLRKLNGG
jgi:predicted Zn-dependent protease